MADDGLGTKLIIGIFITLNVGIRRKGGTAERGVYVFGP
jgi:hypothetical protein